MKRYSIEYCVQWNYKPTALRARDQLLADSNNANSNREVELIEGSGGVFEIIRDGELVFSKKSLNRFPTDEEIDKL